MKINPIRKSFLATGISLILFYLVLNFCYRPFVYKNHLMDYHLADTLGSLFIVPVCTFLLLSFTISSIARQAIFFLFLAFIILELGSVVLPIGVFDYFDVIALIMGTLFSYFLIHITTISHMRAVLIPQLKRINSHH